MGSVEDWRLRFTNWGRANVAVTEQYYTKPVSKVSKAAMAKVEKAFNAKLNRRLAKRGTSRS